MKRIINILVLFIISAGVLAPAPWDYSESDLNKDFFNKAEWKDKEYGKQYFFGGFDFEGYDPLKDNSLDFKIQSEAYNLNKTWQEKERNNSWDNGNFYFLGWSQGGLRALATTTWLKANDPDLYDKLDGVITVSGIDRGLKALNGGVGYLAAKLRRDYQILYYGALSAQRALDGLPISVLIPGLLIPEYQEKILYILAFYFGMNLVPDNIDSLALLFGMLNIMPMYVPLAFLGANMPEIKDMVPGSNFITSTVVNSDGKTKLVLVPDGFIMVKKIGWIKIFGIPIFPYTYSVRETTYKLVEEYDGIETLRIDEEMPLGYIAGLNSDSFSFAKDGESKREAVKYIGEGLNIAKTIHTARMVLAYGYFMGAPVYYGDALNAENYVNNIDYQLNLIKGSSENDGLVALESQYYPKSMHDNVLLGNEEGYEGFDKLNHKNIIGDETVRDKIEKMADLATKKRTRE